MSSACSEGLPILRNVKRLEREIQELQRQEQEEKAKLQQLRQRLLMPFIEHQCNSRAAAKQLWSRLTPLEQEDPEIVYKLLSCSAANLFGTNQWSETEDNRLARQGQQEPVLSERFLSDPLAVLAYFANNNKSFCPWNPFPVPQSMRDNKQVMMAVCAKSPVSFQYASTELRDDVDLVQTALLNEKVRDRNIGHVSERLRKDMNTLLYAVTMGYCTLDFVTWWMTSLPIEQMDIKAQKQIGWVMLRYFSDNSLHDSNPGYDNILVVALNRFLYELRDNKDFMLPFVKLDWSTLQCCSDRLCCDMYLVDAAISQNSNAYHYVQDPIILGEYNRQRRSMEFVCDEVENKGLCFCNVPQELQANKVIILAALKAGNSFINYRYLKPFENEKDFVLDVIAASPKNIQEGGLHYTNLPEHLQTDPDIVKALLAAGYHARSKILAKLPSLLHSRETMMSAVEFSNHGDIRGGRFYYGGGGRLPLRKLYDDEEGDDPDKQFAQHVGQCDFTDDPEFMVKACKFDRAKFRKASERLRSDPDFVRAVLDIVLDSSLLITDTTDTFQVNHPDVVVDAIDQDRRWNPDWWSRLSPGVWFHKKVIMACLQKGWPILGLVVSVDPNNLHLGDKEVMGLAVRNNPADLKFASETLQQDREFVLSLVNETDRVLHHAPANMKGNKDILAAAMARSAGTISDCFPSCFELDEGFEFLCEAAAGVRSAVVLRRYMAASSCRLSCLNQGAETEAAYRKLIGEYADIPLGTRLESLESALANMEKFGF